jgi:hypothetical protein
MTSYISLVVFSMLLVTITIVVQSAPVKQSKIVSLFLQLKFIFVSFPVDQSLSANNKKTLPEYIHSMESLLVSPRSTTTVSIGKEEKDAKKKRNIDNDDKIDNTLHANIKETPAKIRKL